MSTMILLTAEQADVVRGPSALTEGAALAPLALTDGSSILPVEVLDDPLHADHHALLSVLPTVLYEDIAELLPAPNEELDDGYPI